MKTVKIYIFQKRLLLQFSLLTWFFSDLENVLSLVRKSFRSWTRFRFESSDGAEYFVLCHRPPSNRSDESGRHYDRK